MRFSVKKSFVRANPGFEAQVAAHAKEMRDWLDREDRVAKQSPNVPEIDRWVSCPRPMAPNHLVESAVNEKGEADYDVENDDPTPEDLLPVKKARLVEQLHAAEAAAQEAVHPMLKRPYRAMRENEARAREAALRADVVSENSAAITAAVNGHHEAAKKASEDVGALLKTAAKLGMAKIPDPPVYVDPELVDVAAEARKRLDAEDAAVIEEGAEIARADAAVARAAAKVLHDIHDLTVEDVDAYQIPDLTQG